jgi:hypothetical protein
LQDFAGLITGGNVYIDKTRAIHELIQEGNYFFLSRPRRFGKSLLLSTLKYIFLGRKELFEGLWIAESDYKWEKHPVLHFSFSTLGYQSLGLEKALSQALQQKVKDFDVELEAEGLGPRFSELIRKISEKGRRVVLLIDEYDKPLVDYIDWPEQSEANRLALKSFFSVIKDADQYIRFFLITGVSKFSKVSLFSDLNHLRDITMLPQFETIAGITQEELEDYFEEEIERFATKEGISHEAMLNRIRHWYNGYSWTGKVRLYNPFSLLNYMASGLFQNFWWESGTPTFLIKLLRERFQFDFEQVEAGADIFESYTLENLEWRSLMFQTGYLSIQNYDPEYRLYTLTYPNQEVRESTHRYLLAAFRETDTGDSQQLYANIKRALDTNDMPRLMALLNSLLSTIPHQIFIEKKEAFFHAVLHLTFQGLGMFTQSEVSTSKGRVDTVVHGKDHIFVIECKLDGSAESALAQIREKQYVQAFLGQRKPIVALGVNFSSETRMVDGWEVEEIG